MASESDIILRSPNFLGGTPVFRGNRVPLQVLFDYLEGGDTLEEFLDGIPCVYREMAIAALEEAAGGPAGGRLCNFSCSGSTGCPRRRFCAWDCCSSLITSLQLLFSETQAEKPHTQPRRVGHPHAVTPR